MQPWVSPVATATSWPQHQPGDAGLAEPRRPRRRCGRPAAPGQRCETRPPTRKAPRRRGEYPSPPAPDRGSADRHGRAPSIGGRLDPGGMPRGRSRARVTVAPNTRKSPAATPRSSPPRRAGRRFLLLPSSPRPTPPHPGVDPGPAARSATISRQFGPGRLADIDDAQSGAAIAGELAETAGGEIARITFGEGGGECGAHDRPPWSASTSGRYTGGDARRR